MKHIYRFAMLALLLLFCNASSLLAQKKVYGIGESTALVVTKEGVSVEGEGQVVVFESGTSTSDGRGYISMGNMRMDVLTEAATK